MSVTRGCYHVRHEQRRKLGKKKYASLDKTYNKLIAKIEVINVTFTTVILSLSLSLFLSLIIILILIM